MSNIIKLECVVGGVCMCSPVSLEQVVVSGVLHGRNRVYLSIFDVV